VDFTCLHVARTCFAIGADDSCRLSSLAFMQWLLFLSNSSATLGPSAQGLWRTDARTKGHRWGRRRISFVLTLLELVFRALSDTRDSDRESQSSTSAVVYEILSRKPQRISSVLSLPGLVFQVPGDTGGRDRGSRFPTRTLLCCFRCETILSVVS